MMASVQTLWGIDYQQGQLTGGDRQQQPMPGKKKKKVVEDQRKKQILASSVHFVLVRSE
jgi:hypothetical protein